jgi:ubiquinone/menaquinone biosynthesis C-methylase UbiE
MVVPDSRVQHAYRIRVSLFLLAVIVTIVVLAVGYQAIYTLKVLDVVEHDRDRWQQPAEVIEPLNLKSGSFVADIGSGAGYFTLKLAPIVGQQGGVFAVDILMEPLAFLWVRTLLHHQRNVHVVHGDPDNPHLPKGRLDAVLVANTYHELTHSRAVLNRVFEGLHPGGRLVIVDRGPPSADDESRQSEVGLHEIAASAVERDLRDTGFEVISRKDRFIGMNAAERSGDRPGSHTWWLIVAHKP